MQTEEHEPSIRDDAADWVPRPTLAGTDYTTWEVYEQERERIWWGDWVCVGRTEEIPEPGDYIVRDVAGESIFITRNEERQIHGFYNVCSHRGTKFVDDIEGSDERPLRSGIVCAQADERQKVTTIEVAPFDDRPGLPPNTHAISCGLSSCSPPKGI